MKVREKFNDTYLHTIGMQDLFKEMIKAINFHEFVHDDDEFVDRRSDAKLRCFLLESEIKKRGMQHMFRLYIENNFATKYF